MAALNKGTITAKTREEFHEIERELLEDGYVFGGTKGKKMMYFQYSREDDVVYQTDIFMKFWID